MLSSSRSRAHSLPSSRDIHGPRGNLHRLEDYSRRGIIRVRKHGHLADAWSDFRQQFEPLRAESRDCRTASRSVTFALGSRQAIDDTLADRVTNSCHNDGNCLRRLLSCENRKPVTPRRHQEAATLTSTRSCREIDSRVQGDRSYRPSANRIFDRRCHAPRRSPARRRASRRNALHPVSEVHAAEPLPQEADHAASPVRCSARTATGHATAAPPSAEMNCRLSISIAI